MRILVIDDEPSILRALARLLQREGYTVETAGNGRQALARLQVHGYDVLLVDLRMPELDGQASMRACGSAIPPCASGSFFSPASATRRRAAFLSSAASPGYASPTRLQRSAAPLRR